MFPSALGSSLRVLLAALAGLVLGFSGDRAASGASPEAGCCITCQGDGGAVELGGIATLGGTDNGSSCNREVTVAAAGSGNTDEAGV